MYRSTLTYNQRQGMRDIRCWSVLILVGGAVVGGGNACPPCPPGSGAACSWRGAARDECFYAVRGGALTLQVAGDYCLLTCPPALALDDPAVPPLPAPRAVPKVVVERCRPPSSGSYAAALLALNVSVLDELVLSRVSGRTLHTHHLAGLPRLRRLVLQGRGDEPLAVPADMLGELTALQHLQLTHVALPTHALIALPRGLHSLHVSQCGVVEVPEAALSRLTHLTWLTLDEPQLTVPPPLSATPALAAVVLGAPLRAMPHLHTLINATIGGAMDVLLPRGCGSLRRLNVFNAAVTSLPVDWLPAAGAGGCGALRELRVVSLRHLTALHERALLGAGNLTALTVSGSGRLTALPDTLLRAHRHLRMLDLSRNGLLALTDGVFSALSALQQLDVSHNMLSAHALSAVAALPALRTLRAAHNPLGDLCPPSTADTVGAGTLYSTQLSPLSLVTSLQSLSLRATGARRACADWRRQLVRLTQLDLSANNLTDLTLDDLVWERPAGLEVSVDVRDNPLQRAVLSAAQYTRLQHQRRLHCTATLRVDAAILCDCTAYWMARAAKERLLPAALQGATCRHSGAPLKRADLTAMVCADVSQCSAGCACSWRPHDDTLLVSCASGRRHGNDTVSWPPLQAVHAARVELDLSRANLTHLPPTPPPAAVCRLDLTHNALTDVGVLLARDNLTLRLRHNPLLCHCTQVNDLHRHRNQIEDFDNVTCSDGPLVATISPRVHCGGHALVAVLVAVAAASVVAGGGALLARTVLRRQLHAALRRRRYKRQPEPHYMYDGFLAFSHHDSEAAERVMERLEGGGGGARGLRLCVHHRDWTPGEWVPAAVARSVDSSRRTVALLSRHFAASTWARAELRHAAARAAAGRGAGPVLVLLEPVPPDMRPHVRRHRTLRWGDPRLWDELRRLLAPAPHTDAAVTAPGA